MPGPFPLVYLVFDTLFNLVDAQRQADCFRNVARVLAPGGAFVVEAFVPNPADFDRDEQVQMRDVTEDSATMRLHRYDQGAEQFIRQTIRFDSDGVHLKPFAMRYAWPHQIDEMAVDARLRLAERYADWRGAPFNATSTDHIRSTAPREVDHESGGHGSPSAACHPPGGSFYRQYGLRSSGS